MITHKSCEPKKRGNSQTGILAFGLGPFDFVVWDGEGVILGAPNAAACASK